MEKAWENRWDWGEMALVEWLESRAFRKKGKLFATSPFIYHVSQSIAAAMVWE